jgi:hypothetical protein
LVATVGRRLDHESGVFALAAEVRRSDRRSGRPVVSEPLGPHLVEHRPVALQRPHDDSHPNDVGQVTAGGGEDRAEVGEHLLGLVAWIGRDRVRRRVGPEQR